VAQSFVPVAPNAELSIIENPTDHWARVAVCTLWSDVAKMRQTYPYAAVVGPLRGRRGVDELVRNLLANPQIRCLILDGRDIGIGQQGLAAVRGLWDGDWSMLTLYTRDRVAHLLPAMLRDVALVEVGPDRAGAIRGAVAEAMMRDPVSRPGITCPPPPVEVEAKAPPGLPGDRVVGHTVADAWLKAVRLILMAGRTVPTQYGETLELQDLVTVITDPGGPNPRVDQLFGDDAVASYYARVATEGLPEGATYTYGSRITAARDRVEALLAESPLTRAAHVTPWHDSDSGLESGRPCLVSLGYRAVPLGGAHELSMRVAFRSHDYWAGYPINLAALARLLVETAGRMAMQPGMLTCISYSAHLYDRDLDGARELTEGYREVGLRMDYRTTWLVDRDGEAGWLRATALTPDGGTVVAVLTARTAAQLRAKVEQSGLIQEWGNALWLGAEIQRVAGGDR
jgi:thymidylate synthase